ncbi:MAG: DUF72 domain-containing protein [Proteobacteria bacterium]|nr:DUF72 domain-containing protein [Pseudomonadota bacterium]
MGIYVGIGGWTFEPWRGVFYPKGTPKARELQYASRAVTAIEVNGTYYSTFKPDTFRKWADQAPDDFIFALKANRFCTNRRVLADAGLSVERFLESGVTALKSKLGPILWQFAPTKKFDPEDFGAFLALLPGELGGIKLRHALEVRHESFCNADFVSLVRKHNMGIVFADAKKFPAIGDVTSDFAYARLMEAEESVATGYRPAALKKWAEIAKVWEKGEEPASLARFGKAKAAKKKRDVFMFMINGAKVRAPAAAMELLKLLK